MLAPPGEQDVPITTPSNRRGVRSRHRRRRRSHGAKDRSKDAQVVSCALADNSYEGVIRKDALGIRYLDYCNAKYNWNNGVRYEGPFVASQLEGWGKFFWPDGSTYEGEVFDGKRHGEGAYHAVNGITKYEGQWREGKRHGHGLLVYDLEGLSYYSGSWVDGQKHGDGKQVWPSKNTYEGQWKHGRMSGHGTMTWLDGSIMETYVGNWEDGQPQGKGRHSWCTLNSAGEKTGKEAPSQQMNNCYEGEWHHGVRHGRGSFSYASGAQYYGTWLENVKHGQGRYTYENGQIYDGSFLNDHMENGVPSLAGLNRPAPQIGGEDNPVRQCIDISDLEPLTLPADVGPYDQNDGSGYVEVHEVHKEIFNMLLRQFTQLKQVYSQYRKVLHRPQEDPYVLEMHQFWAFARDFGVLTPRCSLSDVDRRVLSGRRHHQEVCYDDLGEIAPLTPRSAPVTPQNSKHSVPAEGSHEGGAQEAEAEHRHSSLAMTGSSAMPGATPQLVAEDGEASDLASSGEGHDLGEEDGDSNGYEFYEPGASMNSWRGAEALESMRSSPMRDLPMVAEMPEMPLYSKFWRGEDSGEVADIHKPSRVFLFRHFLEAIVRLALARYPQEKGLERQLCRLVKEHLVPRVGRPPVSAPVFAFLVNDEVQQVFQGFQPELWRLFKRNATGEGMYGPPRWVSEVEEEPVADELARRTSCGGSLSWVAPFSRSRRQFGGQQRRVHVQARLDVTIRIKDLLQLLAGCGLLWPLAQEPAGESGSLFPSGGDFVVPEEVSTGPSCGLAGTAMSFFEPLPSPASTFAGTLADKADERRRLGLKQLGNAVKAAVRVELFGVEEERTDGGTPQGRPQADPVEVVQCDFRLHFLDVLRIVGEVLMPASLKHIKWKLDRADTVWGTHVWLLEYVESELTFPEFLRFLLRVAERQTQEATFSGEMPPHRLLDGFLRHVFFPSLRLPYVYVPATAGKEMPAMEEERALDGGEKAAALNSQATQDTPPKVKVKKASGSVVAKVAPDAPPLEKAPESQATVPFWRGFDDGRPEANIATAPRWWPEDYLQELAAW